MSGITRRTFLRTTSTAAGLTVVGAVEGSKQAYTAPATATAPSVHAGHPDVALPTAHEDIVRDARMAWRRLPGDWRSAPFFGDGTLTVQVHGGERANELDFVLSPGSLAAGTTSSAARLVLGLTGAVTGVDWTLDLWNAELTGTVTTTRGSAAFTALVAAGRHALLIDLAPSPGEETAGWTAPLSSGTQDAAVRWRERRSGTRRLLAAALTGQRSGDTTGDTTADLLAAQSARLIAAHRDWWHSYYQASLVSVPDKRVQRFYWIQLFKAASAGESASRDGVAHPFLHTANHATVDVEKPWTLPASGLTIPGTGLRSAHHGNPVADWGLPALWSAYRHQMDQRVLRERLYPALTKALTRYEPFLIEDDAGRLHLPVTHSPGYADVADCTYDLSLLRWAATRAAGSATLLGRPAADIDRWHRLATRLAPYHQDDSGVMLGTGVPLGRSQPLPSHLLWLYPLRETRWDIGTDRELMRRSFDHWASMRESWHGRSYAAASSIAAALDAGEEAHGHLRHLLNAADAGLTANTRYGESDRAVDAGAFAATGALLETLARAGQRPGAGMVLDVFPAVPAGWSDVSIAGLRTEEAFLVDASRSGGRTEWIRVRGGTGAPLVVRHDIDGPVDVRTDAGQPARARSVSPREVLVHLAPGETVLLTPGGSPLPDAVPRNVAADGTASRWGLPDPAHAGTPV